MNTASPPPVPNFNPIEADDLARYWEWPIDWWWDWVWPNYDDVQDD